TYCTCHNTLHFKKRDTRSLTSQSSRQPLGKRFVADTHGTNDEPAGSGAHEVEGVAGDQRQYPCGRRIQYRDVLRVDHPRPLDAICLLSIERVEFEGVAPDNVFQSPEEAIPVPGDARVPVRARWCRVLDVTDGTVEGAVVGAGEDGHLESNLRDPEHRERRRGRLARHLEPGTDANWRPQRLVRRSGMRRFNLERGDARQIGARAGRAP